MKLIRKKSWLKIILTYTTTILMMANLTIPVCASTKKIKNNSNKPVVSKINTTGYKLDKVVVLSRHNVRAPLSTTGSTLYRMTPHKWINWSSNASELSTRGGILETEMGQYFRKYLVQQNLFKENEQPKNGSILFYTNSVQRCIATGQYFSSGFLPVANSKIVYQGKFNTMDPVFNPQLTFVNPSFEQDSLAQISLMGGNEGLQGIEKN